MPLPLAQLHVRGQRGQTGIREKNTLTTNLYSFSSPSHLHSTRQPKCSHSPPFNHLPVVTHGAPTHLRSVWHFPYLGNLLKTVKTSGLAFWKLQDRFWNFLDHPPIKGMLQAVLGIPTWAGKTFLWHLEEGTSRNHTAHCEAGEGGPEVLAFWFPGVCGNMKCWSPQTLVAILLNNVNKNICCGKLFLPLYRSRALKPCVNYAGTVTHLFITGYMLGKFA